MKGRINVKCPHCDQLFTIDIPSGINGYDMAMTGWKEHAPELCVEYRAQAERTINELEQRMKDVQPES